ncbi:MAG TPA: LLM class flavin-dependent oxidoreductase [Acidimicrobiales bacterium]|nr:LLM class flavin-dependent oxidoreductase [Acidimicrobiales bacterium]
MRIGVLMLPTDPWPETVARATRLEALGYDHLWTYDHLSWRRYRDRPWHATVPWLTGLAAATGTIRLGTMVASANFRHPVTLAKDAMTLDHISEGRLTLGVGAGGLGFDTTVLGGAVLSAGERGRRLGEFVELLDLLLRQPVTSYRGTYYTAEEARMLPGCVQRPRLPLAVAGGDPGTLGLVARRADAWITYGDSSHRDLTAAGTDAAVRRQLDQLTEECGRLGRDPRSIDRIYLSGNTDERPLASLGAFTDLVGRCRALGFTDIVFHHPRADDPVWNDPEEIVEMIASEVLPAVH